MANRKDGQPKRKPNWRKLYLDLKLEMDMEHLFRKSAEEQEAWAWQEVAETQRLRAESEDRFAEERGALQRRIDELEKRKEMRLGDG